MSFEQRGSGGIEYTDHERDLFDSLPREADSADADPHAEAEMVRALRTEGYFTHRRRRPAAWQLAAALVLFAAGAGTGAFVGTQVSMRHSLEGMLSRDDLSLPDRVLLMQRAGSAYVRAADGYASATRNIDSSAVEVASQVLIGAAQAMARNRLDGGVGAQVTAVMEAIPGARRAPSPPIIWY
jgi:hypothetical protein